MATPRAIGLHPERSEGPRPGMARAWRRRSLAPLGMTAPGREDAPVRPSVLSVLPSFPSFSPFRTSVPSVLQSLPSFLELRLEAQHPAERELIVARGPVLRQLGPADPEGQVEPRDEARVADAVLRAKAAPRVAG